MLPVSGVKRFDGDAVVRDGNDAVEHPLSRPSSSAKAARRRIRMLVGDLVEAIRRAVFAFPFVLPMTYGLVLGAQSRVSLDSGEPEKGDAIRSQSGCTRTVHSLLRRQRLKPQR
jgi:hypothetical protein